jgi:hypothetical protein
MVKKEKRTMIKIAHVGEVMGLQNIPEEVVAVVEGGENYTNTLILLNNED